MKRKIGITGGAGSGKSCCLDILEKEYHARVIQADLVARALMEPGEKCYEQVVRYLGKSILKEDGAIDRKAMAEVIFHSDEKREKVNEITHPLVWQQIEKEIEAAPEEIVVVEAALMDQQHSDIYDEMWYVYTSEENRRARLKESRGYSDEKIDRIIESQLSEEEFRALCSHVIDNNGSAEDTRRQIDRLLKKKDKEEI